MPVRTTKLPDDLDLKVLEYGRKHGIMRRTLQGTPDKKDIPNVDLTIRTILERFFKLEQMEAHE